MSPGREMDALIAEKVMGCKFYLETRGEYTHVIADTGKLLYRINKDRPINVADADPHKHIVENIPKYSTDNAAAISALEHHGKEWRILFNRSRGYRVDVWEPGSVGDEIGYANTLAHAACLALLRSVGAA